MSISKEALNIRATGHDLEIGERDLAQNNNPHDVLFVARAGHLILQGIAIVAPSGKPLDRLIVPDPFSEESTYRMTFAASLKNYAVASGNDARAIISNSNSAAHAGEITFPGGRPSFKHPLINHEPEYAGPPHTEAPQKDSAPLLSSIVDVSDEVSPQVSLTRISDDKVTRFSADANNLQDGIGHYLPMYGASGNPYYGRPKTVKLSREDTDASLGAVRLLGRKAQALILFTSLDPDLPAPEPWLNDPASGRAIMPPQRSSSRY